MEKRKLTIWIILLIILSLIIAVSGFFAGRADAKKDKEKAGMEQIKSQKN